MVQHVVHERNREKNVPANVRADPTACSRIFIQRPDARPDPGAPCGTPKLDQDFALGKCDLSSGNCTDLTKKPAIFLHCVQDRVLTMVRYMVHAQKCRSGLDREHVTCEALCNVGRYTYIYQHCRSSDTTCLLYDVPK